MPRVAAAAVPLGAGAQRSDRGWSWATGWRPAASSLDPISCASCSIAELHQAITERHSPADLAARASAPAGAPLPMAFRLAAASTPIAWTADRPGRDGLAASAGRATGVVCQDAAAVPPDGSAVLVVDTLDPRLAAVLPRLAGLVAETGSALSHLAILAREMHVPAVVAVADARARFPTGSRVLIDGGTGDVRTLTAEEQP